MNILITILFLCDYEKTETRTLYILEPASSALRTAAGRRGDSDNHLRQARQAGKVRRRVRMHFLNRSLAPEGGEDLKTNFSRTKEGNKGRETMGQTAYSFIKEILMWV